MLSIEMNSYVIMAIATMTLVVTVGITTTTAAFAQDPAREGLDRADENVHEGTDSTPEDLSEQDIRFHEGTCQGGHSTTVLDTEFGGCGELSPGGR